MRATSGSLRSAFDPTAEIQSLSDWTPNSGLLSERISAVRRHATKSRIFGLMLLQALHLVAAFSIHFIRYQPSDNSLCVFRYTIKAAIYRVIKKTRYQRSVWPSPHEHSWASRLSAGKGSRCRQQRPSSTGGKGLAAKGILSVTEKPVLGQRAISVVGHSGPPDTPAAEQPRIDKRAAMTKIK